MISQIVMLMAALIHVYIFFMESVLWGQSRVNRVFGMTSEQAEQTRLFAFNQGFYNLFLALGIFVGTFMVNSGGLAEGRVLICFAGASMVGASCVLFFSQRKLFRAALIQGFPPLLGLVLLFFG